MKTFNQLATRANGFCGSPVDDGTTMTNIKQDLLTGLSLFKNAARRYWTRKEAQASLVVGQQDYQMPADFVRASNVVVIANGIRYPLEEIRSEQKWNELNVIPAVTIYIPTKFFIKGNNVISIWPAPSATGTIDVSYEPRVPDFTNPDVTGTATVTNGATTITDSATSFTASMVNMYFTVTDGTDGNWYQIGSYTSNNTIDLANYFQGQSGSSRNYLIGACPDIPEDYHMALAYYAAANFYNGPRKDPGQANQYFSQFQQLLDQYTENYAGKTTGVVQSKLADNAYSVFGIPPTNIAA